MSDFQSEDGCSIHLRCSKLISYILRGRAVVACKAHNLEVGAFESSSRNKVLGRMGEWFKPADLKSADLKGSVRSNRTSSARNINT